MPRWGIDPITLDGSDTLQSAMGKLESSENSPPIVVLASNCRLADSILLYRLIARTSKRLGLPIAVISSHPYWRRLAREHGLYAFGSLGALKRARVRSPVSWVESLADSLFFSFRPTLSAQGWVGLALACGIVGACVYLFVPLLTVTIRNPVEVLDQEVRVKVDAGLISIEPNAPTIPGQMTEHRFSVTDFVDSTGDKKVGKSRARGEVTLVGSDASVSSLPAGTVVTTATGVRFQTMSVATLSAQAPAAPTPGAGGPQPISNVTLRGRATVEALEPGEAGNVAAQAINRLDGDGRRGLAVFNERPLSGGSDSKARTVSADDRSRLRERLFQKAQSQSLAELTVRVKQSESLIPHSLQIRIEGEEFDKAIDEEGDRVNGTVYVAASGIAFANQDLNTVVDREWRKSVHKGYSALPGIPELSPPEVLEAGARTGTLLVKLRGRAQAQFDSDRLVEGLRGLSAEDARAKLAAQGDGLKVARVDVWPEWASRPLRVEVRTVQ